MIESVRLAAAKALYDPIGLQQVYQARMRECRILTQRTEPPPDMWPTILVSTPLNLYASMYMALAVSGLATTISKHAHSHIWRRL